MDLRIRSPSAETTASVQLCIICYERERDVALSCGHANMCSQCVARVAGAAGSAQPRCPTCRAELDLPPSLRRPGLRPVRFADSLPPRPLSERRVRSQMCEPTLQSQRTRRHSALGLGFGPPIRPPTPNPQQPPPPDESGRRVVVLAQRGVAVDAVCERLRRLRPDLNAAPMAYVWLAAAGGTGDAAVAARVRALAPAVLVLTFDVSVVRSFDAVLRWDAAVPSRLPRVWAALSTSGRAALGMSDVRDAAHCLGAPRRTVKVRLGNGGDVRRLAEAVTRCFTPAKLASLVENSQTTPVAQSGLWALIRQCL